MIFFVEFGGDFSSISVTNSFGDLKTSLLHPFAMNISLLLCIKFVFLQLIVFVFGCSDRCQCYFDDVMTNGVGNNVVQCRNIESILSNEIPDNTTDLLIQDSPGFDIANTNWARLSNLQLLSLENAGIQVLKQDYFASLQNLTYLALCKNSLDHLQRGTFSLLHYLEI